MDLPKTYEPKKFEDKIYRLWEKGNFFKPETNPKGKPFCIIMPPPNANGALHIGHAVFVTLEDLITRYKRMQGDACLWLPGTDHAGFETQVVFEKKLEKEGKNRFEIPREKLYQMMWDFTLENKKTVKKQLSKLGASCDFDREKFTLAPEIIKIVNLTFEKLYKDGLIYREQKPVNFCPKHQTSLSDLEIKYVEKKDALYFINYGRITVATVRPETMFGDTAVAVNPKDKRYKNFIGKEVSLPLTNKKIKVIADSAVDPKFGTGVVKVTPAHDQTDFEIWQRHKDEIPGPKIVIDERGRLTKETGKFAGLKAQEAREIVVEEMKKIKILKKIDKNYKHKVATCYKCGRVVEPISKEQWFVAVNKKGKSGKILAKDALDAVQKNKIRFVTPRFKKIFINWMENIRDWNISRQIVWGIRIPAYYCRNTELRNNNGCGEIIVTKGEKPEKCPKCGNKNLIQDPDVFDTWFSSGQWPFASLQAQTGSNLKLKIKNEKPPTNDFTKFYPTDVMETGHDILFFWVARMIMLGLYETGKPPFKNVYLHGLVRDKDRQKMSKSKGNVIDPLGVAEIYGTDAVRMALVFGTGAGNDIIISEEKIRGMRNFANKVWNVSRFILMNLENLKLKVKNEKLQLKIQSFTTADKQILKKLEKTIQFVTKNIENYRFHQAAQDLYQFIWHEFCDKYIEQSKSQISGEARSRFARQNPNLKINTQNILLYVLSQSLKLLHPFMPFVSEAIWQKLPGREEPLIVTKWPILK